MILSQQTDIVEFSLLQMIMIFDYIATLLFNLTEI